MKNLHVLKTDKSSRLSIKDGVLILHRLQWRKGTQHIYITSDEEIKEGDWFITTDTNEIHKSDWIKFHFDNGKKIILTTDQDLIKDGVQAIDDDFLKWFVKNPSCDFIEVTEYLDSGFSYGYKIIIKKKEEHKQETLEERKAQAWIDFAKTNEDVNMYSFVIGFDKGAKWQQERMYSQEEVEYLIYNVCGTVARLQGITLNGNHIDTAYKQFKKHNDDK